MTRRCPLCGFTFEPGGAECRSRGCPLAGANCHTVDCPRCGYTVPDEETSVFARLIRRIWGDSNKAQEGLMRLSDLSTGGSGRVERVEGESQTRMHLAAQGLVAGVAITLRQRLPSFVVEMGETTLAMERKVAEGIWLRRSSADRSGDSPR